MKLKNFTSPSRKRPFRIYDSVESLEELLALVKQEKENGFELIFRGQTQDLPLVPKVGRMIVPGTEPTEKRPIGLSRTWRASQTKDPRLRMETRMLEEFERKAWALTPLVPSNNWELLALAQHHGLPTRLLDWTYNPCVAAWFAVASGRASHKNGVIWFHTPDDLDWVTQKELKSQSPLNVTRSGERPAVFDPRHVASRIRAQDGVFTVHQYNQRIRAFRPMDESGTHRECMVKVLIRSKYFSSIREDLNNIGFNASTIYPDLDGLTRMITEAWSD